MGTETIAAISTALGNSGIGIVRISGEEALAVADKIYVSPGGRKRLSEQESHTVHYGYIKENGQTLDEVLVTLYRAPKSYTTEDTVEINCHGGVYATRRVLEAVLHNGARPAEPGEFTKRAFLNGRIDLSQAESVIDVIQAKNEYALQSSLSQLKGSLSKEISKLRERILYQSAFIESALDDPEHYSLEGYPDQLKKEATSIRNEIEKLERSSDNGRIIKEGIQTVILGKPNAGKSSLLNLLAGEERAIVTKVAGTTRDTLEEMISLGGITLNIIDTAGIRNTEDEVEKIGVDKAKEKAEYADLLIYVADSSTALDENDDKILTLLKEKKSIVLLNKSDLPSVTTVQDMKNFTAGNYPIIEISAKKGTGIENFEQEVKTLFYQGELSFNDEIYITNERQKTALTEAKESMNQVLHSIDEGLPEDFYTVDLMDAYKSLGTIIGEEVGEDLIDEIFGRFCMGK